MLVFIVPKSFSWRIITFFFQVNFFSNIIPTAHVCKSNQKLGHIVSTIK